VAIKAPTSIATHSGQQLAQAIYTALSKPCRPGWQPSEIHLHWIVGHEGVPGNELVDEHAKQAATGESSLLSHLPTLLRKTIPPNPVALRQEHNKQLKQQWKAHWSASPHYSRLQAYGMLPSPAYLTLLQKMATMRAQASLLFQL